MYNDTCGLHSISIRQCWSRGQKWDQGRNINREALWPRGKERASNNWLCPKKGGRSSLSAVEMKAKPVFSGPLEGIVALRAGLDQLITQSPSDAQRTVSAYMDLCILITSFPHFIVMYFPGSSHCPWENTVAFFQKSSG